MACSSPWATSSATTRHRPNCTTVSRTAEARTCLQDDDARRGLGPFPAVRDVGVIDLATPTIGDIMRFLSGSGWYASLRETARRIPDTRPPVGSPRDDDSIGVLGIDGNHPTRVTRANESLWRRGRGMFRVNAPQDPPLFFYEAALRQDRLGRHVQHHQRQRGDMVARIDEPASRSRLAGAFTRSEGESVRVVLSGRGFLPPCA